jgi:hypothetical protein
MVAAGCVHFHGTHSVETAGCTELVVRGPNKVQEFPLVRVDQRQPPLLARLYLFTLVSQSDRAMGKKDRRAGPALRRLGLALSASGQVRPGPVLDSRGMRDTLCDKNDAESCP